MPKPQDKDSSLTHQEESLSRKQAAQNFFALLFSFQIKSRVRKATEAVRDAEWPEYPTPHFLATLSLLCISLTALGLSPLVHPFYLHNNTSLGFDLPSFSPDSSDLSELPEKPEQLIGLKRDQLISLFGEAELTRQEPPFEIWQYRTKSCVLDVYLKGEKETESITYAEIRARHGSAESQLNAESAALCLVMLSDTLAKP